MRPCLTLRTASHPTAVRSCRKATNDHENQIAALGPELRRVIAALWPLAVHHKTPRKLPGEVKDEIGMLLPISPGARLLRRPSVSQDAYHTFTRLFCDLINHANDESTATHMARKQKPKGEEARLADHGSPKERLLCWQRPGRREPLTRRLGSR